LGWGYKLTGGIINSFRNRVAIAIANFALNSIATERYRKFIYGSINYGMDSAIRDELEGRESPQQHWEELVDIGDVIDEVNNGG
jgi:hypothetical protein